MAIVFPDRKFLEGWSMTLSWFLPFLSLTSLYSFAHLFTKRLLSIFCLPGPEDITLNSNKPSFSRQGRDSYLSLSGNYLYSMKVQHSWWMVTRNSLAPGEHATLIPMMLPDFISWVHCPLCLLNSCFCKPQVWCHLQCQIFPDSLKGSRECCMDLCWINMDMDKSKCASAKGQPDWWNHGLCFTWVVADGTWIFFFSLKK